MLTQNDWYPILSNVEKRVSDHCYCIDTQTQRWLEYVRNLSENSEMYDGRWVFEIFYEVLDNDV